MPTTVRRAPFGRCADGRPVERLTLENQHGMRVDVLTYGGVVRSMVVPFGGLPTDVVLGLDTLADYEADECYVGALIGRFANRIAGGRFTIDGAEFRLLLNDGPNQLHGGPQGFNRAVWAADVRVGEFGEVVELSDRSPAGDQGYPGTLEVRATFELTGDNALIISYTAWTDAPTHVNLTWHGYLNLAGHDAGDVRDHEVTLGASYFTPVDGAQIPTGEIRAVAGTAFDFRERRGVRRNDPTDEQLVIGDGYDHNFVIDRAASRGLSFVARVVEPNTARWLEIHSTEPGVQFYLGQHLRGPTKGGGQYAAHSGLALETQHYPDTPNQPAFPSTLLLPGERLSSQTVYRFGVAPSADGFAGPTNSLTG